MTFAITRWTICAFASCGYPVIGPHDCDEEPSYRILGVRLNERGDVVAELSALRLRKDGAT